MSLSLRILFLLLLLGLGACSGGESEGSQPGETYEYVVPVVNNDGWAVGHLDDHGIDSKMIADMIEDIRNGTHPGIDGVAIARDGTLLLREMLRRELDEYDSWVRNTDLNRHVMHSTSKSVTSAIVGIAIDQGYIAGIDVPFYGLFDYGNYDNWDIRKADMTLEDALTMRLGIEWDEWSEPYGEPGNTLTTLTANNADFARALLNLPLEGDPGESFVYNTAATIALGQAVENAVGVPLGDYAEMNLFEPLQIDGADWGRTPTGLPNGGSGLFLKPRDMAKFGQLFLNGGNWNGRQIISNEWIDASVQSHVALAWSDTSGYGFQWWLDNFQRNGRKIESFSTRGYGGQFIFCVPELGLVVAFTGNNYGNEAAEAPFALMQDVILAAIQ